jgi:hypothetical protein
VAKVRFVFLVRGVFFLVFSMWIVPLSAEALSSWSIFAKDMAIRLGIVIGFLLVTPRFLGLDSVDAQRIMPAPSQPDSEVVPVFRIPEGEAVPTSAWARIKLKTGPKYQSILVLCACVFLTSLGLDWHNLAHFPLSPLGFAGWLRSISESLCLAAFVGWLLAPSSPRVRHESVASPKRRAGGVSIGGILVLAGVLVASAIFGSVMWEAVARYGIYLIDWGIFILLWLPKPSANQPELLHVVPQSLVQADKA